MNHTTAAATLLPTVPGTPFEGGFFVGHIRIDGGLFGLVVAPKAEGDADAAVWLAEPKDVPGATSYCDGLVNTIAMAEAGSAVAKSMLELRIGGFDDWYLPARDELELLYRHLKPTTDGNYTYRSGDNPSSVPAGYPYTATVPAQASAQPFQAGGAEAFQPTWYWSSTQYGRYYAWYQFFGDGNQHDGGKSFEGRARAVRRFKV